MIYAEILAGGKGTRMGNTDKPKQFLMLKERPVIIYTLQQFLDTNIFNRIIVCCPKDWIEYMNNLLDEYLPNKNIDVVEGGSTRYETLINGCTYIQENYGIKDEDIIVTHDSVRPFVTEKIILDNVNELKKCDAVNTVIPAVDTIVESEDGSTISNIPNRTKMFQGQSPQSFYIKKLISLYDTLTNEEKEILTDACKIFSLKNKKVNIVMGEPFNFKITTKYDLQMANAIYDEVETQKKLIRRK